MIKIQEFHPWAPTVALSMNSTEVESLPNPNNITGNTNNASTSFPKEARLQDYSQKKHIRVKCRRT